MYTFLILVFLLKFGRTSVNISNASRATELSVVHTVRCYPREIKSQYLFASAARERSLVISQATAQCRTGHFFQTRWIFCSALINSRPENDNPRRNKKFMISSGVRSRWVQTRLASRWVALFHSTYLYPGQEYRW